MWAMSMRRADEAAKLVVHPCMHVTNVPVFTHDLYHRLTPGSHSCTAAAHHVPVISHHQQQAGPVRIAKSLNFSLRCFNSYILVYYISCALPFKTPQPHASFLKADISASKRIPSTPMA